MSELTEPQAILKCLGCGRVYADVGDDHWCECPYCQSQKCRDAIEGEDFVFTSKETIR